MKIILVTGSLNQGGAEFQILTLAKLLRNNNHEVLLVCLTDHSFYKQYLIDEKLNFLQFSNKDSKIYRLLRLRKIMIDFGPAIVISYLKVVSEFTLYAKILSRSKAKFIAGDRTSLELRSRDFIHFNLMRLSDHITVNSTKKLEYIKRRFPFLRFKTSFFPNIIDTEKFSPTVSNKIYEFTKISFIGRISPEKNLKNLILAINLSLSKGYNFQLFIYGDFRDVVYFEEIKHLVDNLSLDKYIKIMGKTDDIISVYNSSDVICLVSFYEGFSNVISEALSCGVPIIASRIQENEYLVEHIKNGFLVDPNSIESISNCINSFMELSISERNVIKFNNRQKALRLFSNEALYSKYFELFNTL